jgi:hypothetical protein
MLLGLEMSGTSVLGTEGWGWLVSEGQLEGGQCGGRQGRQNLREQNEYFKLKNYFLLSKLLNYCSKQQEIQSVNMVFQKPTISVRWYNCLY